MQVVERDWITAVFVAGRNCGLLWRHIKCEGEGKRWKCMRAHLHGVFSEPIFFFKNAYSLNLIILNVKLYLTDANTFPCIVACENCASQNSGGWYRPLYKRRCWIRNMRKYCRAVSKKYRCQLLKRWAIFHIKCVNAAETMKRGGFSVPLGTGGKVKVNVNLYSASSWTHL